MSRMGHVLAQFRLSKAQTKQKTANTETKASKAGALFAFEPMGQPVWSPRDYNAFAREGFMQNAVVYRSVRMIAEAAASVPLLLYRGDEELSEHPLLDFVAKPCPTSTPMEHFEVLLRVATMMLVLRFIGLTGWLRTIAC